MYEDASNWITTKVSKTSSGEVNIKPWQFSISASVGAKVWGSIVLNSLVVRESRIICNYK